MGFFSHRKVEKNYDLLSACSWYTPGVGGLFAVLGFFLVGVLLGSIVTAGLLLFMDVEYTQLVAYPLMSICPFITREFSREMSKAIWEEAVPPWLHSSRPWRPLWYSRDCPPCSRRCLTVSRNQWTS